MRHEPQPVRYEDVAGVKSRVSWGAVVAGAAVALATYLVLILFLAGLGLTINEVGASGTSVGIGTVLAGFFAMGLALFTGGYITAQLTAGETKCESVIYGILTWATVSVAMISTMGMGIKAGYHGLMGAAYTAQSVAPDMTLDNWEGLARRLGMDDKQIEGFRNDPNGDPLKALRKEIEDKPEEYKDKARKAALIAVWTAFFATLLGVACAVAGSLFGSGPEFRLMPTGLAAARRTETAAVAR